MKGTTIMIVAVVGFLMGRRTLCQSRIGDLLNAFLFCREFIMNFLRELIERTVVMEMVFKSKFY